MTSVLVTGIGELVTNDDRLGDGSALGVLHDAALVVEHGVVVWAGPAVSAPDADVRHDVAGRAVVPGFVDSHAHLVFAGDRAAEFEARMTGQPYDGGGNATTGAAPRAATDEELLGRLRSLVAEMRAQGTTTVEVKSGYGLTVADEARTVLTAAAARGLGLRVHGNQLSAGPGVRLAVELGAASVDHSTYLADEDVDALSGAAPADVREVGLGRTPATGTVATLLPGVEFSTRHPYPDARRLLDAGVRVALATDCNPGTCFTSSMPFVIALAVREMGMTIGEALWAATRGGAIALRRPDVGWLGVGARADLTVIEAPSYRHLAYRPGMPLARALDVGGPNPTAW
jgi:imidazolonepropionase